MKHPKLSAEQRSIVGKKVKTLRRDGILPANIYGKHIPSVSIQVNLKEFTELFKEVGETGLVDVTFEGKARPALVKNMQMDYKTHTPLHVDFYQVNLKEKIKTMVPLSLVGEAPAVAEKLGIILSQLSEVEVEALPEALPEHIEVDINSLAAVDDHIKVGQLVSPEGVEILTDSEETVVKIGELAQEEPEEVAPAEETEGEAAPSEEATDTEATETAE